MRRLFFCGKLRVRPKPDATSPSRTDLAHQRTWRGPLEIENAHFDPELTVRLPFINLVRRQPVIHLLHKLAATLTRHLSNDWQRRDLKSVRIRDSLQEAYLWIGLGSVADESLDHRKHELRQIHHEILGHCSWHEMAPNGPQPTIHIHFDGRPDDQLITNRTGRHVSTDAPNQVRKADSVTGKVQDLRVSLVIEKTGIRMPTLQGSRRKTSVLDIVRQPSCRGNSFDSLVS